MESLLTVEELADVVTARLEAEGVVPENGQVSSQPDVRTLRYYATLGLLDRPLARRGRLALYGQRHVAQAVAVKRLQAAGWSLAEIQPRLIGLPTADLQQIRADEPPPPMSIGTTAGGHIQDEPNAEPPTPTPAPGRSLPRRHSAFWAVPPDHARPTPTALVGVTLRAGAVLLLPATRPLTADDARALGAAAAPLLAEASRRGLLDPAVDAVPPADETNANAATAPNPRRDPSP